MFVYMFISNLNMVYKCKCLVTTSKSLIQKINLYFQGKMRCLHYNWTELITSSLPYLGSALPQVVMITTNQICSTIEELAEVYSNKKK